MGVYFGPHIPLPTVTLGLLGQRWRERLPVVQDQPPLPPIVPESFDQFAPSFSFQMGPSVPRVWFSTASGDHLVQLQGDRLVHNWRKVAEREPYPHYSSLRPMFEDDLQDFFAFLMEQGLDPFSITQCEATYVNPINLEDVPGNSLQGLLSVVDGQMTTPFLPEAEDMSFRARFRIPGPTGKPVGRLYMHADPTLKIVGTEQVPVILLQLVARGIPWESGIEGALDFLDLGHDWIIRGFESITTRAMHSKWGWHG